MSAFAADENAANTQTSDIGDPGVRLIRLQNGATTIEVRPNIDEKLRNNDSFFYSNSYLIKIGDVYVKDKSIETLNKLLFGPINSKLSVTIIQGDQVVTKSLNRYSHADLNESARDFGPVVNMSDLFSGWHGSNRHFAGSGKSFHSNGNNFAATPYFIAALKRPAFLMPSLLDDYTRALPEALKFFYRTGMFDRFDQAVENCVATADEFSDSISQDEQELLVRCAQALAECGKPQQALHIYQKLYRSLSRLSFQTQVSVLMGRGGLLEPTEPNQAIEDYKKLAELSAKRSPKSKEERESVSSTLEKCVSFFERNKQWKLAETAQLQVVDLQLAPEGWVPLLQYQPLVNALSKLSDMYQQSGNLAKAQESIEKAIAVYTEHLNADQQILLERSFNLCPSEIRLKLVSVCLRNGQIETARGQLAQALSAVRVALGDNSATTSQLEKIQAMLDSKDSVSQSSEIAKALDPLTQLPIENIDSSVSDDDSNLGDDDIKLARQAYDVSKTNKKEACVRIAKLLDGELSQPSLSADKLTRLINLIRCVETPTTTKQALQMLKRIDIYLSKSPITRLSANRLFATAEIALLSDTKVGSGTVEEWNSLISLLKEMRSNQYPMNNNRNYNDRYAEHDALANLLCVSYFYAFLDEPQKALKIVQHVETTYAGALTNDVSPIIYEAILCNMLGNSNEAQNKIKLFLADSKKINDVGTKMLVALAAVLHDRGQSQRALYILDNAPSDPRNHWNNVPYWKAIIYYDLGQFDKALELLGPEQSISLAGDHNFNYRLMRAELLAKTGQTDKAILAMLKVGADRRVQAVSIERAVALARTMPSIPTPTVEAMVDAVNHTGVGDLDLAQLKYISEVARSHNLPDDKLQGLDYRLSEADYNNPTADRLANARKRAQEFGLKNLPGASVEWANLARLCFSFKEFDDGTAYMLRALQISKNGSFNNGMYHPGNLRFDLGYTMLVNAKQYSNAEKILKQSIEIRKTDDNFKSAYIEKSFLAELFLEQNKFDVAKQWAEQLIATLREKDAMCAPSGGYTGYMNGYLTFKLVDMFTEKKQFVAAQSLIEGADKALLTNLGPRNALFIESNQSQAKLFLAQNKLTEAETYARKALELETWVGGSRNTGKISASLLASVLRKEGKNEEADRVSATVEVKPTRFKDTVKLYNVQAYFSHGRLPERYADTAEEPLKASIAEEIALHGDANDQTLKAYDDLTRFYLQQGRNTDAEKIQLHELEMLDAQYGNCNEPKFRCYLNLSEIYLAMNKTDKALKFAKAIKKAPKGLDYDSLTPRLRWAKVLVSVKQIPQALQITREVENEVSQNRSPFFSAQKYLEQCLAIFNSAGAEEDAIAVRTKLSRFSAPRRTPTVSPPPSLPRPPLRGEQKPTVSPIAPAAK